MIDVVAPDIHPVRDVLLLKDVLDSKCIGQHLFLSGALPHTDNDLTLAILV